MTILSLSMGQLGFIIALAFISLAMITVCLMINFVQQKHRKHIVASVVIFVLNCLNLAALLELNRTKWHQTFDYVSPISSFINKTPYYLQYIFLIASIIFVLYEVHVIVYFVKKRFSINVVREAIENLPTGLAFYDESGFLYLSNRIMHKLSVELTQKDLQNGLELEGDISLLQNGDSCVIKGEEPAFSMLSGEIWQFSKSAIEIEGKTFNELRVDDITKIYHLSDEIIETNERLKFEKIRLADHMKNIGKYISEEETLRVKMAVHDDFGELIARTVRAYERQASKEEKGEVISAWSKLSQKMKHILALDKVEKTSFEKVLAVAKELNCKIQFIGTLPNDSHQKQIIISAVFECLKNAVYHAKVDEITVTITYTKNEIITIIYNEDKTNPTRITEGGGLTTLREKIEKSGGMMRISCGGGGVTLCVTLMRNS